MLRSLACLEADDVTIPCRVRHSEQAAHREFNDTQEMICTMRVWHQTHNPTIASGVLRKVGLQKSRSFGSPAFDASIREHHGPELVLTPNETHIMVHACCSGEFTDPVRMSQRFASFGGGDSVDRNPMRGNGRQRQRDSVTGATTQPRVVRMLGDVCIPVADIMIVDMYGDSDSHQCNITTMSNGYYEFTLESRNGQEIMLAFLKASLPKDRIMDGDFRRTGSGLSHHTGSTTSKSFDVEAFTASRMAERLKGETIAEKLRRKVGRVFSSFEEISTAFTECACACAKDSISPPAPPQAEKRDSPPRDYQYEYEYDNFDATPDRTTETKQQRYGGLYESETTAKRREMLKHCHLPAGLSVEDDENGPEFEKA